MEIIRRVIKALPEPHQTIVQMHVRGARHAEIGKVFGISRNLSAQKFREAMSVLQSSINSAKVA